MNTEISEFYQSNNLSLVASTTLLDETTQLTFDGVDSKYILLRDADTKIVAGAVFIPISIEIGTDLFRSGIITYLCVSRNHRKKGLTTEIIRRIRDLTTSLNIPIAYSTGLSADYPTTARSIPLRSWYRPLRHRVAAELGFEFPSYRNPSDRSDYRTSMAYNCNLPATLTLRRVVLTPTSPDTISWSVAKEFYYINTSLYRIRYRPGVEEWQKWISAFPTYLVYEKENLAGLFSLHQFTSQMSNRKVGKFSLLLLVVGNVIASLRGAINISHSLGSSILYGYEIAGVSEESITEVKARVTKSPIHLSFHLQGIGKEGDPEGSKNIIPVNIETSDLLLPLL